MIKKRLMKLLSHSKKYIVHNILCQWIALLAQILAIFLLSDLFQSLILNRKFTLNGMIVVFIFTGCLFIRYVCERLANLASYKASVDVKKILRKKIYNKIRSLGASYKEYVSTAEVMQVCTEGVEQLEIYYGKYIPQLVYSLLAPITLFLFLSQINIKAAVVLLLGVPLIPISIICVQKIAKKLLNKYWGIYTELGDSFLENLQGLTTLKIYQADENKTKEMDEEAQKFRKITMKVLTMQLNSISVMDIVAYGGAAVGMVVAALEFLNGNLEFSGALMIILLASEFFIPLRLLGSFFHIAMNGMAASDKIFRILDMEQLNQGEIKNVDFTKNIEISDLHFSYQPEREILKGIDLTIPSHQLTSIVGESGCGKSTIAGLLCAKNHGYTGKLSIDGHDISSIDEAVLMKNMVLVRHDSYLFKGTVEYNLKMAKPKATQLEMEEVLKQVNLFEFLKEQKGLQTELLEKASNLSGGQCQRLAIARALLMDAPIYIFDEATSNIDVESEELIMDVIHKLAKEKTVLLISHRLANVVESDAICLLENGNIKEFGTHEELLNKNGLYKELYESQMNLESYGKGEFA